eukprot:scaffold1162_cov170-Amphora_coffeaeformis.AAC.11
MRQSTIPNSRPVSRTGAKGEAIDETKRAKDESGFLLSGNLLISFVQTLCHVTTDTFSALSTGGKLVYSVEHDETRTAMMIPVISHRTIIT